MEKFKKTVEGTRGNGSTFVAASAMAVSLVIIGE